MNSARHASVAPRLAFRVTKTIAYLLMLAVSLLLIMGLEDSFYRAVPLRHRLLLPVLDHLHRRRRAKPAAGGEGGSAGCEAGAPG